MKRRMCSVCDNPVLRRLIDPLLDEAMSFVGISRYAADAGITLNPDVISRHRQHYKEDLKRAPGTPKRDFAILIRDKAYDSVETGRLSLENKDLVPGINAGLKAQGIIDGREKQKSKQANAELAFAIIAMLGGGNPEPLQIEDGKTVEGEFSEVEEDVGEED